MLASLREFLSWTLYKTCVGKRNQRIWQSDRSGFGKHFTDVAFQRACCKNPQLYLHSPRGQSNRMYKVQLRACVKSIDGPRGGVFVAPAKAGAQMTLDSGLRRNDVQGIMLCPDIFEHRL